MSSQYNDQLVTASVNSFMLAEDALNMSQSVESSRPRRVSQALWSFQFLTRLFCTLPRLSTVHWNKVYTDVVGFTQGREGYRFISVLDITIAHVEDVVVPCRAVNILVEVS